jgi:hypothetical protein
VYLVEVKNPCSCFEKNGFSEKSEFETKEAAKDEAEYLLRIMKSNFCQKHQFSMSEEEGQYSIYIK